MSKHTPGPWRASEAGVRSLDPTSGGWVVDAPAHGPAKEDWAGNAALIAAAPEMLDALKAVAEKIPHSRHCVVNGDKGKCLRCFHVLRAIAKAEGQEDETDS